MADEIHELMVKIQPSGVDETTEGLEDVSDQFEETADSADEQSSRLTDFAAKFKGAMQVAVAGLGVATAGLLSRVPVIGEAMSGVEAILRSLQLKIDEAIRPAVSGVTDDLFDLAEQINEAEGPADALLETLKGFGDLSLDIQEGVFNFQENLGESVGESIGNSIIDGIETALTTDALKDLATDFLTPDGFMTAVNEGDWEKVGKALLQALFPTVSFTLGLAKGLVKTIVKGLVNNWQLVLETGIELFTTFGELFHDTMISWTKKAINEVIKAHAQMINVLIEQANNLPKVNISKIQMSELPQLQRRTTGQVFNAATDRFGRRFDAAVARERGRDLRSGRGEAFQGNRSGAIGPDQNAFDSGPREVRITFGPEAQKFLNKEVNAGPLNRGRQ